MKNFKRYCLLTAATCAVGATPALAQAQGQYYSRDKYEAVTDRRQPEFDPEPIRLGAFLVNATGVAGVTSNSNVYASPNNEKSDVIARVGADVSARTNWSVHEIGFDASAYRNEYLDLSDESSTQLRGALRGRLDVTREFTLGASAFAESGVEARTDPANAASLAKPIEFTRTGAEAQANYLNDRVRWTNAVGVNKLNYKDGRAIGTGAVIDEDFRDRTTTEGRTRLSYAVTPDFAVFAQGAVHDLSYDNLQLIGGALHSRDSKGYTVAGGIDFELTSLVRGDLAIGYMNENKDDSYFKDVNGLSVDGRMQWFPTRLTTATFGVSRSVIDAGSFESPSAVYSSVTARVDHELRRNIILSGNLGYSDFSYQEIDRSDNIVEAGAAATYKMNKKVHLSAFIRHLSRDPSGAALNYDPSYGVNLVGVELRLHP